MKYVLFLLLPFYWWENGGTEWSSHLLKTTECTGGGGARVYARPAGFRARGLNHDSSSFWAIRHCPILSLWTNSKAACWWKCSLVIHCLQKYIEVHCLTKRRKVYSILSGSSSEQTDLYRRLKLFVPFLPIVLYCRLQIQEVDLQVVLSDLN